MLPVCHPFFGMVWVGLRWLWELWIDKRKISLHIICLYSCILRASTMEFLLNIVSLHIICLCILVSGLSLFSNISLTGKALSSNLQFQQHCSACLFSWWVFLLSFSAAIARAWLSIVDDNSRQLFSDKCSNSKVVNCVAWILRWKVQLLVYLLGSVHY